MIECGPPDDHIVREGTVYYQEVQLASQLFWVSPHYDRQCHYAFRMHSVSTEADEWGVKGMQPLRGHFQLLIGRKIDDVYRIAVVHEDSPGIEPFYHKHNN